MTTGLAPLCGPAPFSFDEGLRSLAEFNIRRTAGRLCARRSYLPVDRHSFVLRYSEATTLNIQYVRLTPEDAQPDDLAS
jgi:hypothetical protein